MKVNNSEALPGAIFVEHEEQEVFWLLPGGSSQNLGRRDGAVEGCEAGKGQYGIGSVQASICFSSKIPKDKNYLQLSHD